MRRMWEAMVEEGDAGTGIGRSAGRSGMVLETRADWRRCLAGGRAAKQQQSRLVGSYGGQLALAARGPGVGKREAVMVAGWWAAPIFF